MRHTVSCSSGVLAVAAMALLMWPGTSQAQLGGVLPGTTTVLADTGTLAAGTSDALQASQLVGSVPSLLAGEVLHAVTISYPDETDSEASLAALSLNVAGTAIGADSVMAQALAGAGGVVGTSDISNLTIDGVPIAVTGDPNQTIGMPGGMLVINERQVSLDGTTVVNALHAIVSGVADVMIGSATAGPSGGEAKAVQATTF